MPHLSQGALEFHGLGARLALFLADCRWKREWEWLVGSNDHALTLAGLGRSSLDKVLREEKSIPNQRT